MRKRQLEIILEQVEGFRTPLLYKEQYTTPAPIAAELLHFAFMRGDVVDMVYDLGCGTGILAIGAKILGAENVIGFDSDRASLKIAKENAQKLKVNVEYVNCRIEDVCGHAHTVVMNPPFGARIKGSDRPFLEKALEVGDVVYSIHNAGSFDFIKKQIGSAVITDYCSIDFPIKRTFKFHRKDVEIVKAELYRLERRDYY